MTPCESIQDSLAAFLDGELLAEERDAVAEHAAVCAACAAEIEAFRTVGALTRSLPPSGPSDTWTLGFEQKRARGRERRLLEEIAALRHTVEQLTGRILSLELQASQTGAAPEWMTPDEVARYLRLSAETVYARLDEIPHIELDYQIRFRRTEIDRWLAQRESDAAGGFRWSDWVSGDAGSAPLS